MGRGGSSQQASKKAQLSRAGAEVNALAFAARSELRKRLPGKLKKSVKDHDAAGGTIVQDDDGERRWYDRDGELHREDGPAVEGGIGFEVWYRHGKVHREGGPAVYNGGIREWYIGGQLHREDGPALIDHMGRKEWYRRGQLHREDGPAVISHDGYESYYLNGRDYTQLDWEIKTGQYGSYRR